MSFCYRSVRQELKRAIKGTSFFLPFTCWKQTHTHSISSSAHPIPHSVYPEVRNCWTLFFSLKIKAKDLPYSKSRMGCFVKFLKLVIIYTTYNWSFWSFVVHKCDDWVLMLLCEMCLPQTLLGHQHITRLTWKKLSFYPFISIQFAGIKHIPILFIVLLLWFWQPCVHKLRVIICQVRAPTPFRGAICGIPEII